nr:unnamed protein product [Trichobilharzia regenti]
MNSKNSLRRILPKNNVRVSTVSPKMSTSGSDSLGGSVPSSVFRTDVPRINQCTSLGVNTETTQPDDSSENDIVLYGDVESGNQEFNPFKSCRELYANTIVPRNHLRATHQKVLLPSHSIPRLPIVSKTLPSGPCDSGFGVNKERNLRPTVKFLLRIGSALVRHQYESAAAEKANPSPELPARNRRKRQRSEENQMQSNNKKSLVAPVNISHLTWRPKSYHGRWDEIWYYCINNKCPYVPASAMELLRHLEQGHQEFVNIDPLVVLRETLRESSENNGSMINPEIDYGDYLMSRFYVPLPVNMSNSSLSIPEYSCSVCGRISESQSALSIHLKRTHAQLTIERIENPKIMICSVCGSPVETTNLFQTSSRSLDSDIILHASCTPNSSYHISSPWSGCDAHALACLTLNPSLYARFSLPFKVVRFLYKLIQLMMITRIKDFGSWSLQCYTVKYCARISSLYGEFIEPKKVKPFNPSKMSRILEQIDHIESVYPGTPLTFIPTPCIAYPIQANQNTSGSVFNFSTVSVLQSLTTQTSFALPGSVNPTNLCVLTTPCVGHVPDFVSQSVTCSIAPPTISVSQPASNTEQLHSEPSQQMFPTCVTAAKQPSVSLHRKRQTPVTPCSSVSSNKATVVSSLPNHSNIPIQSNSAVSVSTHFTSQNSSQQSLPVSSSVNTVLVQLGPNDLIKRSIRRRVQVPCELCNEIISTNIADQYYHIVCHHNSEDVKHFPSHPCEICGQLFWTKSGLDIHQRVNCSFCRIKLCSSMFFVHEVVWHPEHLAELLTGDAHSCPVCFLQCAKTGKLIAHIRRIHFFNVPKKIKALRNLDVPKHKRDDGTTKVKEKVAYLSSLESRLFSRSVSSPSCTLPNNITVHYESIENPYVKCCICSSHFITVAHLDMHMAQTDHLYLCPLCPFKCDTVIDLRDHCDTAHPSDEISSSKSYRIVNPVPAVTTRSTVKPTPTAGRTVVAPTAREEQRRADNRLHQVGLFYFYHFFLSYIFFQQSLRC